MLKCDVSLSPEEWIKLDGFAARLAYGAGKFRVARLLRTAALERVARFDSANAARKAKQRAELEGSAELARIEQSETKLESASSELESKLERAVERELEQASAVELEQPATTTKRRTSRSVKRSAR